MTVKSEWDGYGSYEAYINRGLGDLFNTAKVESVPSAVEPLPGETNNHPVRKLKSRRRIKPKDVYDIVASYPHHEGDKQWLADMLLRLPLAKREPVMLRYGQVYNSAQSAGAEADSQSGQARRTANACLLGYINQ
jgi:hypothetical protein